MNETSKTRKTRASMVHHLTFFLNERSRCIQHQSICTRKTCLERTWGVLLQSAAKPTNYKLESAANGTDLLGINPPPLPFSRKAKAAAHQTILPSFRRQRSRPWPSQSSGLLSTSEPPVEYGVSEAWNEGATRRRGRRLPLCVDDRGMEGGRRYALALTTVGWSGSLASFLTRCCSDILSAFVVKVKGCNLGFRPWIQMHYV